MILAETLGELLRDPAHWAFEGITDIVYGAIGALVFAPLWRRLKDRIIRRHDAAFHPEHVHEHDPL